MDKTVTKNVAHLNKPCNKHPVIGLFKYWAWAFIHIAILYSSVIQAEIYRWTDDQGVVHYGDQPITSGAKHLNIDDSKPTPTLHRQTRALSVKRVFDGDTLELSDGSRVRLLGINTPELPKRGKPGQPGGEAALEALSQFIKDSKNRIHLSFDVERHDHYGRLLAYIYDRNGVFINEELLRLGHGHTSFKKPKMRQEKRLLAAEQEARSLKRGIWKLDQFQTTTPGRLKDAGNQYRIVKGKVRSDKPISKNRRRIEMSNGFFLLINADVSLPLGRYTGLSIEARGWIRSKKGTPWMKVEHPSQIVTKR